MIYKLLSRSPITRSLREMAKIYISRHLFHLKLLYWGEQLMFLASRQKLLSKFHPLLKQVKFLELRAREPPQLEIHEEAIFCVG